ncbi:sulfate/molybdate ABC transporter ATP-binding protein [Demequina sp. NBRC 110056]|uniref:sulfate/molybdate ABC transporter ATP-binding protein n=1 Tax=Demequina sp. NBRC 110056 TaxID=1570345 RepID=UPI000A077F5A|nr:ATP-binding cassette domain-containing protein [Demequina sp. NBRC 110056]
MSLEAQVTVASRGVDARLAIDAGSTLALLGPNGSGKSTVLAAIAGTVRPDAGRVALDGLPLHDLDARRTAWTPPRRRGIALVTQGHDLFPALTVLDNVAFGVRARGVRRADARDESQHWLARAGLGDLAERLPRDLSGGQARRVAIVRALASQPRVLLLDEPFAGVDVEAATALRLLVAEAAADVTTVITTHDALDAHLLASEVAVLETGRVVEQGVTAEVLTRPRTRFAAAVAGRVLVAGRAAPGALVTADGLRVPADSSGVPDGSEAVVAVAPAAVGMTARTPDSSEPTALTSRAPAGRAVDTGKAGDGVVHDVVAALEPRGDVVRVRGRLLAADVAVADLAVGVGDAVRFTVPQGLVAYRP